MAEERIIPGDVVQLKSGSPKMTVTRTDEKVTDCIYYSEHTQKIKAAENIPTVALKKIEATGQGQDSGKTVKPGKAGQNPVQ
jgi:uncharacterized protein YodC (DUF2158 family)